MGVDPASGGVIHGCYQKSNGQLRVIDSVAACGSSELPISWVGGNGQGSGSGLDADTLDGKDSLDFLGASGKAADSDKLDGLDSTAFLKTSGGTLTGALTAPGFNFSSPQTHY